MYQIDVTRQHFVRTEFFMNLHEDAGFTLLIESEDVETSALGEASRC